MSYTYNLIVAPEGPLGEKDTFQGVKFSNPVHVGETIEIAFIPLRIAAVEHRAFGDSYLVTTDVLTPQDIEEIRRECAISPMMRDQ